MAGRHGRRRQHLGLFQLAEARAVLVRTAQSGAERFLSAYIERRAAPDSPEHCRQPAEMVVMTMAEDHRVDRRGIAPKQRHVGGQRVRRITEVDQDAAVVVTGKASARAEYPHSPRNVSQ